MEQNSTTQPPVDTNATGGCGCGCGTTETPTTSEQPSTAKGSDVTTQTYSVTGMTCGHCEQSVSSELKNLDGVTDVSVDLVAGGTSSVNITSTRPIEDSDVVAALDEAGNYHLA